MRRSIERAVEDGEAQCTDVDLVARLLVAAVSELALVAIQRRLDGSQFGKLDAHVDAVVDALLPARFSGQGRNRPD
jgi:hypothetical protein